MALEKKMRKAWKKGTQFLGFGLLPVKTNGNIDWKLWKAMVKEVDGNVRMVKEY